MTTATIHKFRTRIKPQSLIEAPVDTRTPLMKRLDDIQERFERNVNRPRLQADPADRDWQMWRKAKDINLERQNQRMEHERQMRKRYTRCKKR